LQVQTGGGVRSREDVARILDAGAARVVIGSLAVRQADTVIAWLQEFGADRLTIALDTRQDADGVWQLPVHGWTEAAEATLDQLAVRYAQAGLQHLLCTDIARDGMLSGPNMDLYAHLRALAPQLQVQVSGGARNLADVAAAKAAGCAGIVLGKALLEGHLALKEALAC
ncbi:HisA/HisF-related TIM barrel protein, partial [Xanthomonas arboricola]